MKTKCLLYCTKAKPDLILDYTNSFFTDYMSCFKQNLNGKVVAECEVECEEIYGSNMINFEKGSCVDRVSMFKYLNPLVVWDNKLENLLRASAGRKMGYALHISNLKIFDKPLELSEFKTRHYPQFAGMVRNKTHYELKPLTKAPQNMMWVWYKGERYCLISIRPEWVCKIANGEKTIEVRKKVLKGMI